MSVGIPQTAQDTAGGPVPKARDETWSWMWVAPVGLAIVAAFAVGCLAGQAWARWDPTSICTAVLAIVAGVQALQSERYRQIVQRQYDLQMQPLLKWHVLVHSARSEATEEERYIIVVKNVGQIAAHQIRPVFAGEQGAVKLIRRDPNEPVFPGCCARVGDVPSRHSGRLTITYSDDRGRRYVLEDSLQDVYVSSERVDLPPP